MEDDLGVGGQALGSGENLQRDVLAHNLHHLRQLAADGGQFVVADARGAERHGSLGDVVNLGIYLLKCSCCHNFSRLFGLFTHILLDLLPVALELLRLPLRIVHLAEEVDQPLEELRAGLEIGERKFLVADAQHHLVHHLLAFHRAVGVDVIEGVLLQDDEVDQLRFPEPFVILHRHAVVAQNVDLVVGLLATLHDGLTRVDIEE